MSGNTQDREVNEDATIAGGRGEGGGGRGERGGGGRGGGRNIVCFGCLAVTRFLHANSCTFVELHVYMYMYMEIHVHGILALKTGTCQLKKSVCLCLECAVLLRLIVCYTLLVSFFLPSFSSLIKTYVYPPS